MTKMATREMATATLDAVIQRYFWVLYRAHYLGVWKYL
jgi:hypothetical protein